MMLPHGSPGTSRPRLGFLGVGWIGRHRMEAVAASGVVSIAAIADPSQEALAAAAAASPGATVCASLDDMLTFGLDGVVIATPNALHAEQAIAALEHGAAVFCQKPLARTAEETRRIVDAARRADRLLGVDFSYRHLEGMRRIHELTTEGALGRLFEIDLTFHNAYGPDKAWFYDPQLAGGGCVIDLGVHLIDLALWSLGFPRVVSATSQLYAQGAPLSEGERAEDFAVATLRLSGNVTVRLACSWRASAGRDCVIEAHFFGTEGGAALRNVDGSFYDFRAERYRGTACEELHAPPDAWGGRAVVAWAQRLAEGTRFDEESEEFVRVAEALDAVYAAGRADAFGVMHAGMVST